MSGTGHKQLAELHKKYGEVVRVSPIQVSFNDPRIWKELYGHRKAGEVENPKDHAFYKLASPSVIEAETSEDHGRQRRIMSHAFSAQSLLEQQPLISGYVDLLIQRLREQARGEGTVVNIVKWYDFTTFDLVADLSFGEPFGCLEQSDYHPWVSLIFAGVKQAVFLIQVRRFIPSIDLLLQKFGKALLAKLEQHHELTNAKVAKRMSTQTDRPDFMQAILVKNADGKEVSNHDRQSRPSYDTRPISNRLRRKKMPLAEIRQNASLLIIAGSETTATALAGATYLLCTNHEAMRKLATEVRSAFASENEINLLSVQKLRYLSAVLDEALRMFSPIPGPAPRKVHAGGDVFCGHFLPEGVSRPCFVPFSFQDEPRRPRLSLNKS